MVRTAVQRPQRSAGSTRAVDVVFLGAGDLGLALIDKGTAQSGTSTTLELAETASLTDDQYNTHRIYITGGTGEGQSRAITDYVGSTRTATVAAWGTTPDSTSTYEVREVLTGTPTVTPTSTALTLGSKVVNSEVLWVDGERYYPGTAVQFTVSGGSAGVEYTVQISVATTAGQTLVLDVIITVE